MTSFSNQLHGGLLHTDEYPAFSGAFPQLTVCTPSLGPTFRGTDLRGGPVLVLRPI